MLDVLEYDATFRETTVSACTEVQPCTSVPDVPVVPTTSGETTVADVQPDLPDTSGLTTDDLQVPPGNNNCCDNIKMEKNGFIILLYFIILQLQQFYSDILQRVRKQYVSLCAHWRMQ